MKRATIAAALFMSSLALAVPRQQIFIRASEPDFEKRIGIVALGVQQEGALRHATGNVQVRITNGDERIVIHADEVIYHGDTGEIETRGNARITIEKAK